MANRLKMATVESILRLHAQGWSQRRIAHELQVDRKSVSRYVRSVVDQVGSDPKGANAPTGSAALQPVRSGRRSDCEPYRDLIVGLLDQGLSAQRIYQDLVSGHGFTARYWSVRRFVQGLTGQSERPMRRMEVAPGEEAQVDFGRGAPVVDADGKRRKTNVFRIVLSHSRKGYSEATYTQTTEDFLRALENAFAHFGGASKTLVIDNLKAAVAHPDWFDPVLTPKVQSFCQHYGTVILPTKPYTPRHKGKVEAGVKYVKNNGLAGRTFPTLEAENRHLAEWERSVADTRIHGTTKRQVGQLYADVERAALMQLPAERFAFFHEAQRKVNRDGHVEVAKAYYSVPPEYLARTVWARWDARVVRIFNHHFEQIAIHVRHEKGRFSTLGDHIVPEKIGGVERGAAWLLNKIRGIGEQALAWSEAMLAARGIEGVRVLQGLLALSKTQSHTALDEACGTALSYGAFRLKTLRGLIKQRGVPQQSLPFLDEHPLIRPLADYGSWLRTTLAAPPPPSRHGGRDHQAPRSLPPNPQPRSPLPCSDLSNEENP